MDLRDIVDRIKDYLERGNALLKLALKLYALAAAGDLLGALDALRAILAFLGVI